MKPLIWLRIVAATTSFFFLSPGLQAQDNCDFFDNFSNPTGWTQIGELVTIQNGVVAYQNGAPDGEQRRVHKNLGVSLSANHTWAADIDFKPVSVGNYGGPHAGHAIVSLTAGTQEPFSNCPNPPQCSGYPLPQQDGVICMFGSATNPSDGNSYFILKAIEGLNSSEYTSALITANTLGIQYFVRLERVSSTLARLSVFSDAARTIHLPGSPVVLSIPASIEGLTTVQHGNIARGGPYRELTGEVDNLCINWDTIVNPACDFSDDFSNPTGWTQVGELVTIQNGVVAYQNGAPDGEQRRVHKNLGVSLSANHTWSADIDFRPVSVGNYGGPHAGHAIVSLTAGTQEPFSNCPNPPQCSGYPLPQQDGVICMFGSATNPSDGNSYFILKAIEGLNSSEYTSALITANTLGIQYFVRLERVSPTLARLSVFSDAARTIHLPGSPVVLSIPASIEGLTTVQHGNIARGGPYRELTGEVDNLCINWSSDATSVKNAFSQSNDLRVFPNPAQDQISVTWENDVPANLHLTDVLGRTFRFLDVPVNTNQFQIPLDGLQPGTYFLVWQNRSEQVFSKRFVKI